MSDAVVGQRRTRQGARQRQGGFTLPELSLAIAIFGILSAFIISNFSRGRQANELRQAAQEFAQDIREMQANALAGQTVGGSVPKGGFGVHFSDVSTNNTSYALFADVDGCARYDAADTTLRLKNLPKDVKITDFSTDQGSAATIMDIVFIPPQATTHLNAVCTSGVPASSDNVVMMTLTNVVTGSSRTVTVNRLSGQISMK